MEQTEIKIDWQKGVKFSEIDSPQEVFEKSLINGDPFSNNPDIRDGWYKNLQPPRIELTQEQYAKMKPLSDAGGFKKAYTIEIDDKKYVCTFMRRALYANKLDSDPTFFDEMIKREYAAGLAASCGVDSDVFVAPYGVVTASSGRSAGLLLEYVPGSENLDSFYKEDADFDSKHRDGGTLSLNYFEKLRSALNKLADKNMFVLDLHKDNVLVDEDFNPRVIDLRYYSEVGFDFSITSMDGLSIRDAVLINKDDLNKSINDWERRLV